MGRPREQVLLYAWCPLLVWEIAGSGHVDAAVYAFVTLALLFRYREQPVLTGLFLGLAVMTKFYPLVLLPALWTRDGSAAGLRRLGDWKMPATLAAVCGRWRMRCMRRRAGWCLDFSPAMRRRRASTAARGSFCSIWCSRCRDACELPVAVFMVFCVVVLGGIDAGGRGRSGGREV
jgi:hypothetical protein